MGVLSSDICVHSLKAWPEAAGLMEYVQIERNLAGRKCCFSLQLQKRDNDVDMQTL